MAIFTKNTNAIERIDLKIQNKEFEGVWVEINNTGTKNTIVGCLYRHPHYNNTESFLDYVGNCLMQLNKENKEVYITGDFNLDLLRYETNPKIKEFYNLMPSNSFLPLITQPTRLTENTQTLIDNIFTNTFVYDNYSGNILIEFADHLTQFATIVKQRQSTKKEVRYKLDQTKFDEKMFLEDLSIQTFDCGDNPNARFTDLLWKYEACVKRHMPMKKLSSKEKNEKTNLGLPKKF